VPVRRRDLHQGHVHGQNLAAEEAGDIAEVDGDVLGAPLCHWLAHVGADEEAARVEDALALWGDVGRRPLPGSSVHYMPPESRIS
jgi:hypothetical protein